MSARSVTAAGVTYFTSVTNNGDEYHESSWNNLASFALPGTGTENVHNVGNGSPYESLSLAAGGSSICNGQHRSSRSVAPEYAATAISNESFSSEGGTVHYDASGHKLATPVTLANPAFSSTDGDTTSDPDISPFFGTSAAAPGAGAVATLVLAEDGPLTNTQVSYLLAAMGPPSATTCTAATAC